MYKCLDMQKIHWIEGDTDSLVWGIAGDPSHQFTQKFDHVILDQQFWNEHRFKFFPDPSKGVKSAKKLLGLSIEKEAENMICLSPKCYSLWTDTKNEMKVKGISLKKNKLAYKHYLKVIDELTTIQGKNINLQMKSGVMSKVTINKNALTATHTKMITLSNHSCCPFIHNIPANQYSC